MIGGWRRSIDNEKLMEKWKTAESEEKKNLCVEMEYVESEEENSMEKMKDSFNMNESKKKDEEDETTNYT